MEQSKLISYCNDLLTISNVSDYCPNGLQVAGDNRQVKKVALGVSISLEFIEKAIQEKTDLIITHHGLIWDKDSRVIEGPLREKLHLLLANGVAAAAYHLPLDFHPEIGNNVQLAEKIGLKNLRTISPTGEYAEAVVGETDKNTIEELSGHVETLLTRKPMVLPFGKPAIKTVMIITGGAQNYFLSAVEQQVDCFLTGEASEKNYSMSKEYRIHFIGAGHYATEKFGILALGEHIKETFGIPCQFLDFPNPL